MEAVRKLHISPLVTLSCPTFTEEYEFGIAWRLFGECEVSGPLKANYLNFMFHTAREHGYFGLCLAFGVSACFASSHGFYLNLCSQAQRPSNISGKVPTTAKKAFS